MWLQRDTMQSTFCHPLPEKEGLCLYNWEGGGLLPGMQVINVHSGSTTDLRRPRKCLVTLWEWLQFYLAALSGNFKEYHSWSLNWQLARKAKMGSSLSQTVIILRLACTGRLTTQQCLLAFCFGSVKWHNFMTTMQCCVFSIISTVWPVKYIAFFPAMFPTNTCTY